MNSDIEKALDRIIHESPYNGPIVVQAYRDLLAGAKLFGVPTSHYHRFLSQIEEQALDSGHVVLKELADANARCVELEKLAVQKFNEGYDRAFAQIKAATAPIKKPHANVFEYDGAFKCSDCGGVWGAISGPHADPENCVAPTHVMPSREHKTKGTECWCSPIVDGAIVKHH